MTKTKTKPKTKKSKAVATVEAASGLQAQDYGDDVGAGFEDVTQDDLLIPFLNVLQKGSPMVDEDLPGYIQGAKAGMIINSASEELYPGQEGVVFIPVHKNHRYVEWVPRDQGGGFISVFEPTDQVVLDAKSGGAFGKLESPDGNDLVETFYMFGLLVDSEGSYTPAVVAFASTQIRAYKKWMTMMRTVQVTDPASGRRVNPPMFAHRFRIRTRHQENAKGSWHGLNITYASEGDPKESVSPAMASRLAVDSELYQAARECRSLVMSDVVQVAYEKSDSGGGGAANAQGTKAPF